MSSFDRSYVVAVGAYGRATNEKDWEAGKDFQILGGPYFSIRDVDVMKEDGITLIDFQNKRGYTVFHRKL